MCTKLLLLHATSRDRACCRVTDAIQCRLPIMCFDSVSHLLFLVNKNDYFDRHGGCVSLKFFMRAKQILADDFLAGDATQEAMWSMLKTGSPPLGDFEAWAMTIVNNRAFSMLSERRRRRLHSLDSVLEFPDSGNVPARVIEDSEDVMLLHRCLQNLGSHLQKVVELLYGSDSMTLDQVGEMLKVSTSTAQRWRQRAVAQLKACMKRQFGAEEGR